MTHRIPSVSTRSIDLTLALFKPDVCANPIVTQTVISTLQAQKFTIVKSKNMLWRQQDAELFYDEHKGKFFYERLCGYMASGQFKALILAKENAIQDWRALIGPTHPVRAKIKSPNTLRAHVLFCSMVHLENVTIDSKYLISLINQISLYGLTDTRNSFHGSGSSKETCLHSHTEVLYRLNYERKDSIQNAKREIEFFFADFDIVQWMHQK